MDVSYQSMLQTDITRHLATAFSEIYVLDMLIIIVPFPIIGWSVLQYVMSGYVCAAIRVPWHRLLWPAIKEWSISINWMIWTVSSISTNSYRTTSSEVPSMQNWVGEVVTDNLSCFFFNFYESFAIIGLMFLKVWEVYAFIQTKSKITSILSVCKF